jgi:hypothetical protein
MSLLLNKTSEYYPRTCLCLMSAQAFGCRCFWAHPEKEDVPGPLIIVPNTSVNYCNFVKFLQNDVIIFLQPMVPLITILSRAGTYGDITMKQMHIQNITVFGAGRIGSQVAFHTAFHGFRVVVFDINDEAVAAAKERMRRLAEQYMGVFKAPELEIGRALGNLSYSVNMSESVTNADLVIEAIPRDAGIKSSFYRQLSNVAPDKTIFASSSSTLPSSACAADCGRPDRFMALQFSNEIWKERKAGLTIYKDTNVKAFYQVMAFLEAISLAVLPIHIPE